MAVVIVGGRRIAFVLRCFLIASGAISVAAAEAGNRFPIISVGITHDPRNREQSQIAVRLDAVGAVRFSALTRRNIGENLVAVFDGKPITGPIRIASRIDGGIVVLPVGSPSEAEDLAKRLASGTSALGFAVEPGR